MKTRSKYHHGELREVLLALAVQQIAAVGIEKLSIRELARQARVSATAPFRHFPDKLTLLAALAIDGFTELAQRMQSPAQTKQDWETQFLQLGSTYVQFAEDYPVHYQLMFGAVLGDFSASRELQEASASAYAVLDATLTEIKSNQQLEHDVAMLGGLVWSTVHGMASLVFNVPMAQLPKGADEAPRQAVKSIHEDMRAALKMVYLGITS